MGKLESDIKRLGFPQGEYKRCLDGSCYELNTENETLIITSEEEIPPHIDQEEAVRVIEKWGEKKARIYGDLLGFLSLILLLFLIILLIAIWASGKGWAQILLNQTGLSGNILWYSILATIIALFFFGGLGSKYTNAVNYCISSKCKNCSRNFALEEFKKPLFKEVSTLDKYEITRTRYWKCKLCGIEDYRTEKLNYDNHKGKKSKQKGDTCRICKKEFAMSEYRNPDVKRKSSEETTVRHYKCLNCGFREITVEKVILEETNVQ